ncbi:MAG: sigma-70 family RNA polymerase sigma factor [Verrucomicrobiae bacterium]|nr:sigma-70 family RNA polymerase sigma factor [Verrucomicrobiae bacterium]
MNDRTDQELLRDYAAGDCQAAFAELARRHLDFVHSAAARMVVDRQLAEDVTQAVFVALARQAVVLQDRTVLTGWLHRTAQNLAAKAVRTEVRRRAREHHAAAMQTPPNETEADAEAVWDQIAPHLDAALGQLDEPDRDVLLLRYFERQSAREIGTRLGLGEEAAQKRVSRALERLRSVFVARGLAVPATSLGGVLLVQAVQAAPAGLAATVLSGVASTAAAAGAGASSSFLLLKLMASTQLKVTVASLVTAGFVTTLVLQQRQNQQQLGELTRLRAELAAPAPPPVPSPPVEAAPADPSEEVLRLRGQVARLLAEKEQGESPRASQSPRQVQTVARAHTDTFPRENWAFAGYEDPESTMISTLWAGLNGDLQTFLASMTPEEQARNQGQWGGAPESQIRDGLVEGFNQTKAVRVLGKESLSDEMIVLNLLVEQENGHSETPRMLFRRIGNEWRMAGRYQPPQQTEPPAGSP